MERSADRKNTIEWDGKELQRVAYYRRRLRQSVSRPRRKIHAHAPGFNDALTWEIDRHRVEIFEKLSPFFRSRAAIQA